MALVGVGGNRSHRSRLAGCRVPARRGGCGRINRRSIWGIRHARHCRHARGVRRGVRGRSRGRRGPPAAPSASPGLVLSGPAEDSGTQPVAAAPDERDHANKVTTAGQGPKTRGPDPHLLGGKQVEVIRDGQFDESQA